MVFSKLTIILDKAEEGAGNLKASCLEGDGTFGGYWCPGGVDREGGLSTVADLGEGSRCDDMILNR